MLDETLLFGLTDFGERWRSDAEKCRKDSLKCGTVQDGTKYALSARWQGKEIASYTDFLYHEAYAVTQLFLLHATLSYTCVRFRLEFREEIIN